MKETKPKNSKTRELDLESGKMPQPREIDLPPRKKAIAIKGKQKGKKK